MRVPGHIPHHPGDGEGIRIQRYRLAEGVGASEVLARHGLGDDDRPRILQRLCGIAPHQWKGENLEEIGIRPEHAVFEVRLVFIAYDPPSEGRTYAGV